MTEQLSYLQKIVLRRFAIHERVGEDTWQELNTDQRITILFQLYERGLLRIGNWGPEVTSKGIRIALATTGWGER